MSRGNRLVSAYQQAAVVEGIDTDTASSRVIQRLPAQTTITEEAVEAGAPRASGVLVEGDFGETTLSLPRAGTYRITRESDGTLWDVIRHGGDVELEEQVQVELDGADVTQPRKLSIAADNDDLLVALPATMAPGDARSVAVIDDRERVRLPRGGRLAALEKLDSSVFSPPADVGDCNAHDDRSASDTDLAASLDGAVMRLSARAHSACVADEIDVRAGNSLYKVKFQARTRKGLPARGCAAGTQTRRGAPAQ